MNGLLPIAWNGFREARRNRVTVVVAAFAVAILLCSTLVSEVTVATFDRVLTDFGLGSMSLIMVFLAIFLSCGVLSREIERRTIFMVVSKPVSRS
ncbi:MAG: ABC transporter permease subunit, partial [Myxococcaceae bacterium]